MRALSVEDWPALQFDDERETMSDFDATNFAFAEFCDDLKEFDHLSLEPEVRERGFRTRTVVAAHLQLLDDRRRWREEWLTSLHVQLLKAAVGMLVAEIDEADLPRGKR